MLLNRNNISNLGWNFHSLGASVLVLECHNPEEKNRVQSLNDFVIFGLMAIGSFSSGGILLWMAYRTAGLIYSFGFSDTHSRHSGQETTGRLEA